MEDKSIDCVVTDPPYGNGTNYDSYIDSRENLKSLVDLFMVEVLRIADRIVVTPGVKNLWLYPEPSWVLAWVNPAGIGSSSWGFCCWQPILVYGKDPFLADGKGRRPDTFFQRENFVQRSIHPCPKPTNVMEWIIDRVSRENETILDPFMGSGTTGEACIKLNRKFFGIELSPEYFSIAKERIASSQLPLL